MALSFGVRFFLYFLRLSAGIKDIVYNGLDTYSCEVQARCTVLKI